MVERHSTDVFMTFMVYTVCTQDSFLNGNGQFRFQPVGRPQRKSSKVLL